MLDPDPIARLELLHLMEMPYAKYDDETIEEIVH